MANSVIPTGNEHSPVYEITGMDSDWVGRNGPLQSIQFNPGATSDVLVVKNGSTAGPMLFSTTADSGSDETIKYFYGVRVAPVIDYSECTLSAGHEVIVVYGE
ncbi:MAG: hypothetical protein KGY38_06435 [Desulfobacterales bacterium]|nr:hypothetical protein [Desulfobacterales bacterium]